MSRAIRSDTLNGTDLRKILGSKATMTNEQYTEYQGRMQEFTSSSYYQVGVPYRNILFTLYNPQNQMHISNQTDIYTTSNQLKSIYTLVRAHEAIDINKGVVEDSLKALHDMTKNLTDFEKQIQLYQLQRVIDGSMQASQVQNYYGNEKLTKKKAESLHQIHNDTSEIIQEMITTILDEMNGGITAGPKEFMTNYRNYGLGNWDYDDMFTNFQNGNYQQVISLLNPSHVQIREVFDSNTIDFIFSKEFLEPSHIFDSYMNSESPLYPYMGNQYSQNHALELIMRVIYLSEIKKNNPQVKTLGITNISAYNRQSYYFKEDVNQCRKKNTTFYDFTAFPTLTAIQIDNVKVLMESLKSKIIAKIDGEYAAFVDTQAVDMENFYKDAEQAQKIMVDYWKAMIQQAYKEKKEDYIAALYGNYLASFPYQDYNIREWLGDYMTANPLTEVMTHGAILRFHPEHYITVSIQYRGAYTDDEKFNQTINDFSENVKHEILSLGIPAYISAPLRQQFYDRRTAIDERYNQHLQSYARQIQQNENKRRQELDETNEALNKVFHGEYHFV